MSELTEEECCKLEKKLSKLDLDNLQYHIFLCSYPDKAKCCQHEEGAESWEYLKQRLKELDLKHVQRTRANCLRVCKQGPIAVVYPQGVWYRSCSPSVLERIIQEHFIGGKVVEEYVIHPSKKSIEKE